MAVVTPPDLPGWRAILTVDFEHLSISIGFAHVMTLDDETVADSSTHHTLPRLNVASLNTGQPTTTRRVCTEANVPTPSLAIEDTVGTLVPAGFAGRPWQFNGVGARLRSMTERNDAKTPLGETIRLGKVYGIQLGAHWSVLVIGWLLVWALADGTFPVEAPGASSTACWLVATATVVLFWAGLLAHEVAHSVVATRLGVPVEGITLWLFGGVSRLRRDAQDPAAELRIAVAGPAASVVIALAWAALAGGMATIDGPDLLVAASTWLAIINGMLAVFNLVPAAPLDGGRILHAVVWRRSGNQSQATITATNAGRAFGYVLIGIGVLVLAAGDLSGLWFAFLGWFLLSAARAEATHVLVHEALAGVRIRDVMSADPVTAPAQTTIAELIDEYLLRYHCSAFPLVDPNGRVAGVITLRRLKHVLPQQRANVHALDVAWPVHEVAAAAPDEPVVELIDRIAATNGGDGRALVFEHGRLIGIVSPTDLNRAVELARLHPPTTDAQTGDDKRGEKS